MGATAPTWLTAAATDRTSDQYRWCLDALAAYYREPEPGRPDYSGARFDDLGDNPPDRVAADDLVAVSLLSVEVPPHAALRLLGPDAEELSRLLAGVPDDVDLHDADERLVNGSSCGDELWKLLRRHTRSRPQNDGLGPVTASKLLARKRPRLFPIWDRAVSAQRDLARTDDYWRGVRSLLRGAPRYVELLRDVHDATKLPDHVSVIRTLDVLLWTAHERRPPPR